MAPSESNPATRAETGPVRMFAATQPGLGPLLRRELTDLQLAVEAEGNDGRSDLVLFQAERPPRLRTAEDVFVEIGRTLRSEGDRPQWIANRIWKPARLPRALALWRGRLRPTPTFHVVARVLQERSFLRTELRRHLTATVTRNSPRWKAADPAQLEIWVGEYRPGRFVCGLRLTDARTRQHGGRQQQRHGALRPAAAAAMVALAGSPKGTLLDPCCGSGTILAEARARGWAFVGSDVDREAIEVAGRNLGGTDPLAVADVHHLDRPEGSVAACVSNLPFGRQYEVDGDPDVWLRATLSELARVTAVGGRVVLLAPRLPGRPAGLRLTERFPITLLGQRATIWCFDRR